jgi:uncharacterized protein
MSPQWILIAVLIAAVYFFFIKKKPLSSKTKPSKKEREEDGDEMVECKKCGTYISLNEALIRDGQYFCSDECLRA